MLSQHGYKISIESICKSIPHQRKSMCDKECGWEQREKNLFIIDQRLANGNYQDKKYVVVLLLSLLLGFNIHCDSRTQYLI